MRLEDICSRNPARIGREQPLVEAVRAMLERRVGALVVVEAAHPERPCGMLTDRDIVSGQLARRADLNCLSVGEVMSADLLALPQDLELSEAIEALNRRGVRRAPVIDSGGSLVGVVSLDDLLPAVSQELGLLARLMSTQARSEGRH